jgi:hypothetical protein
MRPGIPPVKHCSPDHRELELRRRRSWRALRLGRKRAAVLVVGILALSCVPLAMAAGDGQFVRGARKNPTFGGYSQSTQIWANTSGWGTRQSNLGNGGSAIYGCRSPLHGPPCLDADNLKGGLAFTFISTGATGGSILVKNSSGAPFTTNGHGVASGLNANYLQGYQASSFQQANQPAANANALGGQPPSSYVSAGQLLYANVSPGASGSPTITNTRGATSVTQSGNAYTVTFGTSNVSRCSYSASPQGGALSSGQLGVAPSPTNPNSVVVSAPSGFTGGFDLQVVC